MPLSPNQFAMEQQAGRQDLGFLGSVVSCQVASDAAAALVPGQTVKIVDSAGGVPKVEARVGNTEGTFGVVLNNLKDVDFPALARVEIALKGTVVYMTAGAAIARGARVECAFNTHKVVTNAGVNPAIGWAYDKASGDNDIIRVFIETPVLAVNLGQLADVTLTSPTDTQIIEYDTGVWINAAND